MVVLRCEQQFLLLRRARPPFVGMYLPVGGKLEPYEDPHSAARREAQEETGLEIPQLRFAGTLTETSPTEYNWMSHIYVADIPWVEPPHCDEGDLTWITFEQLPEIPTPPTDWQVYQYLLRGQPFVFNAIYDEHLNLLHMTEEIEGKPVCR
ncbi:MAG: NUDIX domain-containing protein [Lewinellaceae bacterium]|nr:NUDIX domain-containing protein [Lewinellaceae bacterium]